MNGEYTQKLKAAKELLIQAKKTLTQAEKLREKHPACDYETLVNEHYRVEVRLENLETELIEELRDLNQEVQGSAHIFIGFYTSGRKTKVAFLESETVVVSNMTPNGHLDEKRMDFADFVRSLVLWELPVSMDEVCDSLLESLHRAFVENLRDTKDRSENLASIAKRLQDASKKCRQIGKMGRKKDAKEVGELVEA